MSAKPLKLTQKSFTGGVWATAVEARSDVDKYRTAVRRATNFYPSIHGGMSNRAGTRYAYMVKPSKKNTVHRSVTFQFSVEQYYTLLFGDGYIWFFRDRGIITLPSIVSDMTDNGSGAIRVTAVAHGFTTGRYAIVSGVVGISGADGLYALTVVDADNFDLVGSNFTGSYGGGASVSQIVEVATNYAEADLPSLKFEQSFDKMWINHPTYAETQLTRTSHTAWTLTSTTFASTMGTPTGLAMAGTGAFFAVTAVSADGIESLPSTSEQGASAGAQNLTWSAVTDAAEYRVYQEVHGVYRFIGTSRALEYFIPASFSSDHSTGAPVSTNPFFGAGNYPAVAAFYEQRLVRARTNNKPQTLFGSVIGDFNNANISSPLQDNDAYTFTINSSQVNEVLFMVPLESLILFTTGGEWRINKGAQTNAVTPTSVSIVRQSSWGCAPTIKPLLIGDSILFVDESSKRVRDLLFSLEKDGYRGNELTVLVRTSHVTDIFFNKTFNGLAYQPFPESIVWAWLSDGTWAGMTYYKEHNVWGWHFHNTDGAVESMNVVRTSAGDSEVYMVVRRTIDGAVNRYVEVMDNRQFARIQDAYFVDCGATYNGYNTDTSVTATLSGASWSPGDSLDLIVSGSMPFTPAAVGFYMQLRTTVTTLGGDGRDTSTEIYSGLKITGYVSSTRVTVTPVQKAVPAGLRNVATSEWAAMRQVISSGLSHLEGKEVVCLADGNVVRGLTVTGGAIALPAPAAVIHIGLGYDSDMETLDLEFQFQDGSSLRNKKRATPECQISFLASRSCLVGQIGGTLTDMDFGKRNQYGDPLPLLTGRIKASLSPTSNLYAGSLHCRVVDPVPCTISEVELSVNFGND